MMTVYRKAHRPGQEWNITPYWAPGGGKALPLGPVQTPYHLTKERTIWGRVAEY